MAESDEGAPSGTGLPDEQELDSVDQEFGNEYSEETLNILRGIQRPEYLQESSSLDPLEDLDLYVENNLSIPPATYDALMEVGAEELAELQAAKDFKPHPQTEALVRYRQQLAQGTSHQDMAWLKLRAYHRAMDELHAMDTKRKAQAEQQLLQEYDVPVGEVPADLLRLTPAQLAERQKLALIAKARAAAKAERNKSVVQRLLSRPDPSEDSEWESSAEEPSVLQGIQEAFLQHTGLLKLQPRAAFASMTSTALAQTPALAPQEQAAAAAKVAPKKPPRTLYTQAYLDQQALQQRIQRQKRQRSAAFWLSFLTVSGAYLIRYVRRQLAKKPRPPSAGKRTAAAA